MADNTNVTYCWKESYEPSSGDPGETLVEYSDGFVPRVGETVLLSWPESDGEAIGSYVVSHVHYYVSASWCNAVVVVRGAVGDEAIPV